MVLVLSHQVWVLTVVIKLLSLLSGSGEGIGANMTLSVRLDQFLALIAHNWVDSTHTEAESTLLRRALTVSVVVRAKEGLWLTCTADLRLALGLKGFHAGVSGRGRGNAGHDARLHNFLHWVGAAGQISELGIWHDTLVYHLGAAQLEIVDLWEAAHILAIAVLEEFGHRHHGHGHTSFLVSGHYFLWLMIDNDCYALDWYPWRFILYLN